MRTFTERQAKDLICPLMFAAPESIELVNCRGVRCMACTEASVEWGDKEDHWVLEYYCAAMPGNRE